jgi:hypothetical protein
VVGGLVVSQLLTLYITPVFYLYMEKLTARRQAKKAATDSHPMHGDELPAFAK